MNIYTMEDWKRDGVLKVEIGQVIAPEVFYELRDCIPPTTYGNGIFQVGEAEDYDWDANRELFCTYEKVNDKDYYKYVGLRPA